MEIQTERKREGEERDKCRKRGHCQLCDQMSQCVFPDGHVDTNLRDSKAKGLRGNVLGGVQAVVVSTSWHVAGTVTKAARQVTDRHETIAVMLVKEEKAD